MPKFYDLHHALMPDGSVHLIQSDCGEDTTIAAHPEQLRYITQQVCGRMVTTRPDYAADLERRLSVLAERLQELVVAQWLRTQIVERCSDGVEILCRFDSLLDLAIEFDGRRLLPEHGEQAHEAPTANELIPGNSQTPPQQFELA
jgi:hypothetical protein